jgi:hypothetical protein
MFGAQRVLELTLSRELEPLASAETGGDTIPDPAPVHLTSPNVIDHQ